MVRRFPIPRQSALTPPAFEGGRELRALTRPTALLASQASATLRARLWSCQPMASLTVRNMKPALKERLCVRAARHGRSMEEPRHILHDALEEPDPGEHLVDVFAELFGPVHGIELNLLSRVPGRGPQDLA
jgi:antitoxin FitA